MTERRRVSSKSPYEDVIGFSRAVRVGDTVYVSGTVAWGDDGKLVGEGDVYLQARQALRNIERALAEAGASMRDVVRTRTCLPAGRSTSRTSTAGRRRRGPTPRRSPG